MNYDATTLQIIDIDVRGCVSYNFIGTKYDIDTAVTWIHSIKDVHYSDNMVSHRE